MIKDRLRHFDNACISGQCILTDKNFNEVMFEDHEPFPASAVDHPVMRLAEKHGLQMI